VIKTWSGNDSKISFHSTTPNFHSITPLHDSTALRSTFKHMPNNMELVPTGDWNTPLFICSIKTRLQFGVCKTPLDSTPPFSTCQKWHGGHELIKMFRVTKQANTNISLRTYTCTSYFPEYIVYNKCENVNIMSY
jgi:hypothetical protein